ncbi:MAG TPA: hypothetical protein DD706_23335 [Nitrospiraceae bacterium]|nr:hypothetical protein [Nitrospiraceae bacterium]
MKHILCVVILLGTITHLLHGHAGAGHRVATLIEISKFSGSRLFIEPRTSPTLTSRSAEEHCFPYDPKRLVSPKMLYVVGDSETIPLAQEIKEQFSAMQKLITLQVSSESPQTPPWWQHSQYPTVALMSEQMDDHERLRFKNQWGYEPTQLRIAADPVVPIVHPSNPLAQRGITLSQLKIIFSQTAFPQHSPIRTWKELNLEGDWKSRPIILHGYDASASLGLYFKNRVLQGADLSNRVHRHPGSGRVVFTVGEEKGPIGFTKLSTITPQAEIVPIRVHSRLLHINKNTPLSSAYPLDHYLYLNLNPQTLPDGVAVELLRFIYSRQGQSFLKDRGYLPLSTTMLRQEWNRLPESPPAPCTT